MLAQPAQNAVSTTTATQLLLTQGLPVQEARLTNPDLGQQGNSHSHMLCCVHVCAQGCCRTALAFMRRVSVSCRCLSFCCCSGATATSCSTKHTTCTGWFQPHFDDKHKFRHNQAPQSCHVPGWVASRQADAGNMHAPSHLLAEWQMKECSSRPTDLLQPTDTLTLAGPLQQRCC